MDDEINVPVIDKRTGQEVEMIPVYEWKHVECDDCGRDSKVVKWIPLKLASCGHCGSLKLRIYRTDEERRERNRRLKKQRLQRATK